MELKENKEQPIKDSSITDNQPNADDKGSEMDQTHTLSDGTEVSTEELKNGYMRQSDYTKKTTALAEEKKSYSDEDQAAMDLLKKAGFATMDDIKAFWEKQATEQELDTFKHSFHTLNAAQLKTVQDLKKVNPDKSYEQIAEDYGIIDEVNLQRAKWGSIRGNNLWIPQPEKKEVFTMKGYKWDFLEKARKYI